ALAEEQLGAAQVAALVERLDFHALLEEADRLVHLLALEGVLDEHVHQVERPSLQALARARRPRLVAVVREQVADVPRERRPRRSRSLGLRRGERRGGVELELGRIDDGAGRERDGGALARDQLAAGGTKTMEEVPQPLSSRLR